MLSLRSHFRIDRLIAAVMVISPWLFGFSQVMAARNVFLGIGIAMALYASAWRMIPPVIHTAFDVFSGFFLMIAPYFYQYRSSLGSGQALLHFAVGLGIWSSVVITRNEENPPREQKLPKDLSDLKTEIKRNELKKTG